MMSNIPLAREKLHQAAQLIHEAIDLMTREPAVRRTPSKRTPITPRVRSKINRLALTALTMNEIAQKTGVRNQGRVSEVLNGKR